MKHVNVGEKIKISRTDVNDIRRVAMEGQRIKVQNGNQTPDLQFDYILVKNLSGIAISRYSVIGIEAPQMDELKYDNYYYDPNTDQDEKNNPIEISIKNNGYSGMLYRGVIPTYRDHQSSFGILQSDLEIDEIGWCICSGYAFAIFDNKTEYQRDRMQVRLQPETELKIGKTKTNIPLIFDSSKTGGEENIRNSFGSPILIQPGKWLSIDNLTTIPVGLQIARVWLGTSFDYFWDAIWSGKL